jgi:hypothetical protein
MYHYNQTNILENQTLLLARVRFIRMPLAAFWCGFSKNSWRGLFCDSVMGFDGNFNATLVPLIYIYYASATTLVFMYAPKHT